jgi:hypothetical protein
VGVGGEAVSGLPAGLDFHLKIGERRFGHEE